jgi:hypothetical protein
MLKIFPQKPAFQKLNKNGFRYIKESRGQGAELPSLPRLSLFFCSVITE